WLIFVALPIAAAIFIAIILLPRTPPDQFEPKGRGVFALSVEGAVWDNKPIAPNARIQMLWSSSAPAYVAVLGKQKSGGESILFPTALLPAGADQPLGASIIADASIDGAELILISGPSAFEPDESAAVVGRNVERIRLEVRRE